MYDPKALQHIVLKDQDIYEEALFAVMPVQILEAYGLERDTDMV